MSDPVVTVELPMTAFEQLQGVAREQQRSVQEVVRDLILRELPGLPPLPPDAQAELAAFANLSDEVLWLLARSTLPKAQQQELARLNDEAQRRALTEVEQAYQQALVEAYDRTLLRRAQAAALLKSRGFDLPVTGLASTQKRLNITGVTGLTEAPKASLKANAPKKWYSH